MNAKQVAELQLLRSRHPKKLLVAAEVVDFASNPNTALHKRFDWDDSSAAHKFRLVQARNLIKVVVHLEPRLNNEPIPKYVSLPSQRKKPGGGYHDTVAAARVKQTREEMLDMAFAELERFKHRYSVLKQLAGVFSAINAAAARRKRGGGGKKSSPKKKAK